MVSEPYQENKAMADAREMDTAITGFKELSSVLEPVEVQAVAVSGFSEVCNQARGGS
jgi:hypothetical protein